MNAIEVASKFVSYYKKNNLIEIYGTLYSKDAKSIEKYGKIRPKITLGLDAIILSTKIFNNNIMIIHKSEISDPITVGNHFIITRHIDVTFKNMERHQFDEIGVYEVQNGKIILEQFFN